MTQPCPSASPQYSSCPTDFAPAAAYPTYPRSPISHTTRHPPQQYYPYEPPPYARWAAASLLGDGHYCGDGGGGMRRRSCGAGMVHGGFRCTKPSSWLGILPVVLQDKKKISSTHSSSPNGSDALTIGKPRHGPRRVNKRPQVRIYIQGCVGCFLKQQYFMGVDEGDTSHKSWILKRYVRPKNYPISKCLFFYQEVLKGNGCYCNTGLSEESYVRELLY